MSEVAHLHSATGAGGVGVCLCNWGARSLYVGPALGDQDQQLLDQLIGPA